MVQDIATAVRKVLIVDDHPVMRAGMKLLLESEDEIEVCAEIGSVKEAIEEIGRIQPDLVLADLTLPDGSGLELIKDAVARWPKIKFLVVSMHDESLYAERVLRAGGRGYVMKEAASEHLLAAIRRVLHDGIYVSEAMASRLLASLAGGTAKNNSRLESPLEVLTDRELEVFELVGLGRGTKAIAKQLSISVKTVEAHCANIRSKLSLADRNALVRYAVRWAEAQGR